MLVVVCVYDDLHRLDLCLAGFAGQTTHDFDLVVVNDGGLGEVRDVIKRWKRSIKCRLHYDYFEPKTSTFRLAAARNRGTAYARSDRVLYVDGDCVPAPDLVAVHQAYGADSVVVAGRRRHVSQLDVPQLTPSDLHNLQKHLAGEDKRYRLTGKFYGGFRRKLHENPVFEFTPGPGDSDLAFKAVWGCNMSFPWQTVMNLGGFWERFQAYGGEDQEMAWRAWASGCRLMARFDTWVWHLDHKIRSDVDDQTWRRLLEKSRANKDNLVRNGGPLTLRGARLL